MSAATPTVPALEYARRREALAEAIGEDGAAIVFSAPVSVRSNDVEYPYRQSNDLLYLTGFREPEAACVLVPGHPDGAFHLFVRPRDPERETWTGRRAGVEGAVAESSADKAYPIAELDERIAELVAGRRRVYYTVGAHRADNERVLRWLQQWQAGRPRLGSGPHALEDLSAVLHEMRLRKTPVEVEMMRHAAGIAREAHVEAMRAVRPGMWEYEVEAQLDFDFRRRGATGPAYPSIVAGGMNATILHYTENDQALDEGALLLIDAGAEYGGYCSDITRTFPVGAAFSAPQRAIYEVVLAAQEAAIDAVRPGVSFDGPHEKALAVLIDGLIQLGLLADDAGAAIESESYKSFYMHRTSHWLGLDVHDVGRYRDGDKARLLEPGMVLTIEPGLYVSGDSDSAYRGIGVRIEDDVLVTDDGLELLSEGVPKAVDEIEALRRAAIA